MISTQPRVERKDGAIPMALAERIELVMPNVNSGIEPEPELCVCRECMRRWYPKRHQSKLFCENCQPLSNPQCVHAMSLYLPCKDCLQIHGGKLYMRVLPPSHKKMSEKEKKTTYTRRKTV